MSYLYKFLCKHQFISTIHEAKDKKSVYLNASSFDAEIIPEVLYECQNLERLYLKRNKIVSINPKITNLFGLSSLALDYNTLEELPSEIGTLYNLTSLNVSHNPLKKLQPEICYLEHLEELWCNCIETQTLPENIGCLSLLDTLGARTNQITELPASFINLSCLRWLTLENNLISCLPQMFGNLQNLVHLNLSKNLFCNFPDEILKCFRLQYVYLNCNQISNLNLSETSIEDLHAMKSLVYIDLRDNPMTKNSPFKDHLKNHPKLKPAFEAKVQSRENLPGSSVSNVESYMSSEWEDSDFSESSSEYDWEVSCPSSLLDSESDMDVEENGIVLKHLQDISKFISSGS